MSRGPPGDPYGLVGQVVDGRYRIVERVASGGFGTVYAAEDAQFGHKRRAVKVLHGLGGYEEEARERFQSDFRREANIIDEFRHAHIPPICGYGDVLPTGEQAPWMALAWIDGVTLAKYLQERRQRGEGGMTIQEGFELLKPVVDAIAYAHRKGIAHRDLKPANVMLELHDGVPYPWVLDFGTAKRMPPHAVPHGAPTARRPVFTPHYGAPEQFEEAGTGPWTDVYALALLFVEALTGVVPYGEEELTWRKGFELSHDPVRPSPARFGVSVGALEPVLLRALAVNSLERYQDATALLAALTEAVRTETGGEAAGARPAMRSPPPSTIANDVTQPAQRREPASPSLEERHVPTVPPIADPIAPSTHDAPSQPLVRSRRWVPVAVAALVVPAAAMLLRLCGGPPTRADGGAVVDAVVPPPPDVSPSAVLDAAPAGAGIVDASAADIEAATRSGPHSDRRAVARDRLSTPEEDSISAVESGTLHADDLRVDRSEPPPDRW